jgi:hypothetical protein
MQIRKSDISNLKLKILDFKSHDPPLSAFIRGRAFNSPITNRQSQITNSSYPPRGHFRDGLGYGALTRSIRDHPAARFCSFNSPITNHQSQITNSALTRREATSVTG